MDEDWLQLRVRCAGFGLLAAGMASPLVAREATLFSSLGVAGTCGGIGLGVGLLAPNLVARRASGAGGFAALYLVLPSLALLGCAVLAMFDPLRVPGVLGATLSLGLLAVSTAYLLLGVTAAANPIWRLLRLGIAWGITSTVTSAGAVVVFAVLLPSRDIRLAGIAFLATIAAAVVLAPVAFAEWQAGHR